MFQSLIGSNENCNGATDSAEATTDTGFQSLIGSNENCNSANFPNSVKLFPKVSIPNRE